MEIYQWISKIASDSIGGGGEERSIEFFVIMDTGILCFYVEKSEK